MAIVRAFQLKPAVETKADRALGLKNTETI